MKYIQYAVVMALATVLASCTKSPTTAPVAAPTSTPAITNRIDTPESVRSNLGITFATVARRNVARTIRVPGRFEISPQARREYRTMLDGRVELRVSQFDRVAEGQVLYSLESPSWRELQESLSETESQMQQAQARVESIPPLMAAHERHHDELKAGVEIWVERVRQLEQNKGSGVVTAEELAQTRAAMVNIRSQLAEVLEKEAELQSRKTEVQAQLTASHERFELLLSNAASLSGLSADELRTKEPDNRPRWRSTANVEIRAAASGVVEAVAVTNGAWVQQSNLVLSVIRPDGLRFLARALQSDLTRLSDGLPARVLLPKRKTAADDTLMEGTITLGLVGDADERTVNVFMTPSKLSTLARPGVAAHLEIVAEGTATPELAIPASAVIRDGLHSIIFRRDSFNANRVIRLTADLGITDGQWTVIQSGVKEGDQVVLDGVYPLMLASSATMQKGGHFHADGTWHAGDN